MRVPPGYLKAQDEGKVLLLLCSLCGIKQAGFEWSEELEKFFLDARYMHSQVNQAVYFRCIAEEHTVITVSVDDMAVTSKHMKHIDCFKVQLHERFEISNLGELIRIEGPMRSHEPGCEFSYQQDYVDENRGGMHSKTPQWWGHVAYNICCYYQI
jgi:hypothetical protein